jgi:putative membrane protein
MRPWPDGGRPLAWCWITGWSPSMKKMVSGVIAVVLTSATVPLGVGVMAAGGATTTTNPAVSAQDVRWMQGNAQTDLAEITIGKIALKRARYNDTKTMTDVTISDHTKALAKLKTLAKTLNVTLPAAPTATQKAQAAQLKTVAVGKFDRLYDNDQIAGHLLSISKTKTEISVGKDAAVTAFAKYYLPVAQKHLRMARADLAALNEK